MMYSVYNYTRRMYDYYDAPGPAGTHAGSPPLPATSPKAVGESPARAAWRLPPGARHVGSGEFPRGSIASLSGIDGMGQATPIVAYLALGYLAWRILR